MGEVDGRDVLAVLRKGEPLTKTELAQITGQARSTVALRLDALVGSGLVKVLDEAVSTGGRPSLSYAFNDKAGVVLVADIGASHAYLGVADLGGELLAQERESLAISDGPTAVLDEALVVWRRQLKALGLGAGDVRGAGIGLPGPVEHSTGRPVSPPIMPGWDGFDVPHHISAEFGVPVFVDNDVNILALGEWTNSYPDETDILVVKVATGIGAGVVSAGRLVRGAQGAAGDIGHVQVIGDDGRSCRCGQIGCLEAYASGRGIAETIREQGGSAETTDDVVALVRAGDASTTQLSRDAGRLIGRVLSMCVALLNPGRIVIGGEMAMVGETLLAGVRETIYKRSQPLATRQLSVVTMRDPASGGLRGAARLVLDEILA